MHWLASPLMDTSTVNKPAEGEVPTLHGQALANLRFIRETMEGAGYFTAVPGSAGVVMGAIGLLAAAVAAIPGLASLWLQVWLIAAVAATTVGGVLIAYKARTTGITLYRGPAKRFVLSLLPALLAGVIFTVVLVNYELPALIPGTWMVLYGCAVMAASLVSLPVIAAMGAGFMLLGTVAFLAPVSLANLLLGAGFGGLHLVFGMLLAKRHRG